MIILGCVPESSLESPANESPVNLTLSLSPVIKEGEELTEVTLTVRAERDIIGASGSILLPEGLELVEGNLDWVADLEENKPEEFKVLAKAVKEGEWVVQASSGNNSVSARTTTTVSPAGYIFINESAFYKKERSYVVGLPGGSFNPEPLKGEALNSYFKSLNLTEEYIYGMMQFETLGGDPTNEQAEILGNDNITLFEYHGDHTYYAKIPRSVLETKSYDFVRWIGIIDDPLRKIAIGSIFRYFYKNCTGPVQMYIISYERLNENQINRIKELTYSFEYGDVGFAEIDVSKIYDLVSLDFVKKIEQYVRPRAAVMGSETNEKLYDVTCNKELMIILSFEENINEGLYSQIENISEEIIYYEPQVKQVCILINPVHIFNPTDSFMLIRHLDGFMIYKDPYSVVSADFTVDKILKNSSCE